MRKVIKERYRMKINVSDLAGAQLDYWVAQAERIEVVLWANEGSEEDAAIVRPFNKGEFPNFYQPSKNWMLGGPIIERERIAIFARGGMGEPIWGAEMRAEAEHWIDTTIYECDASGPNPLIAAMRAYVASKFGEMVEVPA